MHILDVVLGYVGLILWVFGIYMFFRSDLRALLGQAWSVVWRKKYLWFIGFFAGLTSYGGEVNFLFRKTNSVSTLQALLDGIRNALQHGDVERFWQTGKNLWANNASQMAGYSFTLLAIVVVIIWLVVTSQAAMVRIVGRTHQNKPTGLIDGLSITPSKFWSLVQVNIVAVLVGWGVYVLLAGVPAAAYLISGHVAWSTAAHIGTIISTVTTMVILFLLQYATAEVVLRDMKPVPAVINSWRLFRRNVLASFEMAIVIFTLTYVFSLAFVGTAALLLNIYTVSGFLWMLALLILVYSFFSAFGFSAWTIFYLRLLDGKAGSKLEQWTNQIVNFATQKRGQT